MCRLRAARERAGLTQVALAERAQVTRQTLIAIEAERSVPSTAIALALAAALGCRVEDLFELDRTPESLRVRWAEAPDARPASTRALVGRVGGRWVAHPLRASLGETWLSAADAVVASADQGAGRVEPLLAPAELERNLLVAGCAPALGVLARHLERDGSQVPLRWVHAGSTRALEQLERGDVHIAGTHLLDETTGEYNVAAVRRRFARRRMLLINLARWEAGLVVPAGNPGRIRGAAELARPKLRVAQREAGAGASLLLASMLRAAGLPKRSLPTGPRARSHAEVAELVAHGVADVGLSIRSAAQALGLDFVPVAEERFDLVLSAELARDPRVERLINALGGRAFRRDAAGLGGHRTDHSGEVMAELSVGAA